MAFPGLAIRLHLDHNVDPRLAADVRRHGFEVTSAREIGKERASDEEHLAWAAEHGRVILTFDVGDFRVLARRWLDEGRDHAGILISIPPPPITYGELLRRLLAFLDRITAEEMVNRVEWLDPTSEPDR